MSRFSHHESCPNCGSRDNVGVWEDGHKWCFGGCGYYLPPDDPGIKDVWDKINKKRDKENGSPVLLPSDFSYTIPSEPLKWLQKYDLTEREILKYKVGWTYERQGFIFPAFDVYGNLLLYQRRGYPEKEFHTEGLPERVDFVSDTPESRSICVVEDFISTIKVGRHIPALCLWGSTLSLSRIKRLARYYDNLIIWLDKDKASYAVKRKIAASPFFSTTKVIITDKDPKEETDARIQQMAVSTVSR